MIFAIKILGLATDRTKIKKCARSFVLCRNWTFSRLLSTPQPSVALFLVGELISLTTCSLFYFPVQGICFGNHNHKHIFLTPPPVFSRPIFLFTSGHLSYPVSAQAGLTNDLRLARVVEWHGCSEETAEGYTRASR